MIQRDNANQEQFWMVWNPLGRPPTAKHRSEQSACAEAKRLALANKGQHFYVLQATDCFVTNDVQHIRLYEPDMPF